MKRVSITFLPHPPVKNRAQVLQTPPYTFIHYATPSNRSFFLSQANTMLAGRHLPVKYCIDITIYLTNLHQNILHGGSHKEYTLHNTMWTTTNNKKGIQTLNTPLNESVIDFGFSCSSPERSNDFNSNKHYYFNHKITTP
jgi:hypothetical protein